MAATNYARNKITDAVMRGQALGAPATWYLALFTAAPTVVGGGTEVAGGAYARVGVVASLVNFAGTQAAGSTTASTGTTGTTSNNGVITHPAPTANWGTVTHYAWFDALTGGNMWFFGTLTTAKVINNGDAAPSWAAGQVSRITS